MVRYRRNRVPGGTFFFTVALANRRSRDLVEHIAALRKAFRSVRMNRPFAFDAIVVLPEHLHAIFTLPEGDDDFSGRWRRIKNLFVRDLVGHAFAVERNAKGEYGLSKGVSGSTQYVDQLISSATSITSTTIRSSIVSVRV